jgi:DNA-binding LytR/AlgR family response regulator
MAGKFTDPMDALNWLKSNQCHLLFLDISMPQITGLQLVRELGEVPVLIFTTAYHEFACEAFELDAADYLLKPFSFDRFDRAVRKATDLLQARASSENNRMEEGKTSSCLTIRYEGKRVKIAYQNITYIQAYQEYVMVYTASERYIIYERLKNIEKALPPDKFCRIHRSYIVRLDCIGSYTGSLADISGFEVPVGRTFRDEFLKRISL